MISELANVYGITLSTSNVRVIGTEMIQMLVKLGLVEATTSLIAGIFKSTMVGYAAGGRRAGGVAGVSHPHLGRDVRRVLPPRPDLGRRRHAGGSDPAVRPDQPRPSSSSSSPSRPCRRSPAGSSTADRSRRNNRRPRIERPARTSSCPISRRSPATVPRPEQTIAGIGRAAAPGRGDAASISSTPASNRSTSGSRRSTPGSCSIATGRWSRPAALDEELRTGKDRGPLHGIPIGIKDIIDVQGLPTACGAKRWADRFAERTPPSSRRLREAGAVIMGKTVTTPYAWIDPPPTRNPWNLDRTPGGSSSGSAAAVACGMCLWRDRHARRAARSPGRRRSAASPG